MERNDELHASEAKAARSRLGEEAIHLATQAWLLAEDGDGTKQAVVAIGKKVRAQKRIVKERL